MTFRKFSTGLLIALLSSLFIFSVLSAQDDSDEMDNGFRSVQSELSFEDTVLSAQQILEAEGFGVPLVLDHSANAASVDLDLSPTTLILFGNPMVGTSLMQESRSMAIDLPQKFLVWEDDAGNVYISYNDPLYLADRHEVTEQGEKLDAISNRLQSLAEQIAITEPMMDDMEMEDDEDGEEDSED